MACADARSTEGIRGLLHLFDVKCTEVPAGFGLLTNLTSLALGVFHPNEATPVVHPDLGSLQQLIELCLTNGHLRAIPAWVGNLPRLESLILKRQCFTPAADNDMRTNAAIAPILRLTRLAELRLTRCELLSLPCQLSRLSRLASLRLGENFQLIQLL